QAQRVARAEPDRPGALVLEQPLPETPRVRSRDEHLEAVLAGVAGAGDDHPRALQSARAPVMNESSGADGRMDAITSAASGPCTAIRLRSSRRTSCAASPTSAAIRAKSAS